MGSLNNIHGGYKLHYEYDDLQWYQWELSNADDVTVAEGLVKGHAKMTTDVERHLLRLRLDIPDRALALMTVISTAMRVYETEHRHGAQLATDFGRKIDGCVACTMAKALEKGYFTV